MLRLSDAERVRDGRRRRAGRAERQGDQAPHGCYVQRGVELPVNPLSTPPARVSSSFRRRFRGRGGSIAAKFVVSLVVLRRTTERV